MQTDCKEFKKKKKQAKAKQKPQSRPECERELETRGGVREVWAAFSHQMRPAGKSKSCL